MTLPLPKPNVQARAGTRGPARLTPAEKKALAKVENEATRSALGELFITARSNQANFDHLAMQFPIQPENAADAVREPPILAEAGMGVIVHGATANKARGEEFPQYTWIGSVKPENMAEFDIWIDTA